jgi:hypothetical protein
MADVRCQTRFESRFRSSSVVTLPTNVSLLLFEAGSGISHGIDKLLNAGVPLLVIADLLFAEALEFRELLLGAGIVA